MPSQKEVCRRFDATPVPCTGKEILGIAIETIGKMPINGLRQNPENGTCGWYIWYGEEMSEDTEFFKPLHVSHISKYLPGVEQYLSLPPGYRFLVAGEYRMFGMIQNLPTCNKFGKSDASKQRRS